MEQLKQGSEELGRQLAAAQQQLEDEATECTMQKARDADPGEECRHC